MTEQLELEQSTQPVVLNTPHARAMLHRRYPAPEWALMEEVAPHTGGGTRYADAIAVNLWRSRGHAIHGFEIKVSRSDWLRELKDPSKAEPVYRYCDHWWIVAPKGVVKDGELPPTWGLLELRASWLVQVVAAPRLEATPVTRAFFASLMRRGHEQLDALAERKQRHAVTEARDDINKRVAEEVERRTRYHRDLEKTVAEFTEKTGLTLDQYSGPPIQIVRMAKQLAKLGDWSGEAPLAKLARLAGELDKAATTIREAMASADLTPSQVDA